MEPDHSLLNKYFKGHCTEAEQAQVEQWLQQPDQRAVDAFLHQQWEQPKVRKMHRWKYAAAAAVLALLGSALWWQQQPAHNLLAAAPLWDTIANPHSAVKAITMPDGSKVWLNAFSSIAYRHDYNATERLIHLHGEAYFEVAPQAAKPFKVAAGQLLTTALGTTFNITTHSRADGSIQVSLLSGKVAVADTATTFSQIMSPGQMLTWNGALRQHAVAHVSSGTVLDWKSGKLVLNKTSLEDVFARLQARYGTPIELQWPQGGKRKVSGIFSVREPLEHILMSLQFVHGFTYAARPGGGYIISRPKQ